MPQYLGLNDSQVLENQKKYGPNKITKGRKVPLFVKFLLKFTSPLVLLLLFSSVLSIFLHQRTDFYIIFLILLISVVLDVYQEHQAQDAAEKLAQKIVLKATVIRNGKDVEIDTDQITIDDLVKLFTGSIIPADCKILESVNFSVDQSILTGESYPSEKKEGDSAFMGTHVVSGFAVAKVVSINNKTEIGRIAKSIGVQKPQTDFEKGLNNFSLLLIRLTFILSLVLLLVNFILGHNFINSLSFVLALAIGFAPELLPVILTINLTKGAIRLSHKGVIVKYLPSIENFGSMDVLCTDKTGTLTVGDTVLKSFIDIKNQENKDVILYAYLNSYFQTGFRNPIDNAILGYKKINARGYKKIKELSYDFFRKRSSVIVESQKGLLIITKGAVQSVLPHCVNRDQIKVDIDNLNDQGFRLIAVAFKKIRDKSNYNFEDESDLTCLGFLIFYDPPKTSAIETVKELQNHGIDLKILTGDNSVVTQSICREIGIKVDNIMTGERIRKMADEELKKKVEKTNIFSELDPESKLRIIASLKQNGHVVGFLGDGINDAPSLKKADVGISVNNAVDVAQESADLILLHKDLSVLLVGVREGRTTFANIMKYISMGTSSTFGNMLSLSIASLVLPFLPMLPVQVLLNDLLYDVSQTFLVRDNVDKKLIQNPYKWNLKRIKNFTIIFGSISSIFDLVTFYLLFRVLRTSMHTFQTGWFLESIVTQMFIIFSIRTYLVPFFRSKINPAFAFVVLSIILFVLWLPFSFLAPELHLISPPPRFYLFLLVIVVSYFSFIEIAKYFFYRKSFKQI